MVKIVILFNAVWVMSPVRYKAFLQDWVDGKSVVLEDYGTRLGVALDFGSLDRSAAREILEKL
jgi:hypothetical protein